MAISIHKFWAAWTGDVVLVRDSLPEVFRFLLLSLMEHLRGISLTLSELLYLLLYLCSFLISQIAQRTT